MPARVSAGNHGLALERAMGVTQRAELMAAVYELVDTEAASRARRACSVSLMSWPATGAAASSAWCAWPGSARPEAASVFG